MILLRKKHSDGSYFEFDKIIESGYSIDEQPNLIAKKQFVNGKRKKIVTDYTDTIIKINLGCFDGVTLAEYIKELADGEFEFYSINDKIMKKADFITTLPEQVIENCAGEVIVSDFEAILEKSGDII